MFIRDYKSCNSKTASHMHMLLNHSAPHGWGNPPSLRTAWGPNRKMDTRWSMKSRLIVWGGSWPARNPFDIASGRSHGTFPYQFCPRDIRILFFYVIMFWFLNHQNPGTLRSSSSGLPELHSRAPASCTQTFRRVEILFYYQQLHQEKKNYLLQV